MADDQAAEIPIPGDDEGDGDMGQASAEILEQTAIETNRRISHQASRLQDISDNIYNQTSLGYLTEQRVVGTREAKASSMLHPVQGQPLVKVEKQS